jgi:thioesterase domain-containing protein
MDSETVDKHSQIETLAAMYVEEIRSIQAAGPYYLSGHSAAGIIAFEVAQQLRAQGEDVALLAILESRPFVPHRTGSLARGLMRFIRRFPWEKPPLWARFALGRLKSVSRDTVAQVRGQGLSPWERVARLQANYEAKPYGGPVTLFLANEEMDFSKWIRQGWARMAAAEFEVIVVPGDHWTMVEEPNVRVLAAHFKDRLPHQASFLAARL